MGALNSNANGLKTLVYIACNYYNVPDSSPMSKDEQNSVFVKPGKYLNKRRENAWRTLESALPTFSTVCVPDHPFHN